MSENDVIQFNESHKWAGCFGIITKVEQCGDDIEYMIEVAIPPEEITFIYASEKEIEYIGKAVFVR